MNIAKDNKKYEELRNLLKEEFEKIVSPFSNKFIINKVYKKEEIYHGKYLDIAPDIMLDQAPGIHINGGVGFNEIFSKPTKWKGENIKIGLFLAYGPKIKKKQLKNISILDIAPTILTNMDLSVPKDMDGKILNLR